MLWKHQSLISRIVDWFPWLYLCISFSNEKYELWEQYVSHCLESKFVSLHSFVVSFSTSRTSDVAPCERSPHLNHASEIPLPFIWTPVVFRKFIEIWSPYKRGMSLFLYHLHQLAIKCLIYSYNGEMLLYVTSNSWTSLNDGIKSVILMSWIKNKWHVTCHSLTCCIWRVVFVINYPSLFYILFLSFDHKINIACSIFT